MNFPSGSASRSSTASTTLPPRATGAAALDPVRQVVRLAEDGGDLRGVRGRVGLGHEHARSSSKRSVSSASTQAPDLARDRLELAAHARVLEDERGSRRRRGAGAGRRRRAAGSRRRTSLWIWWSSVRGRARRVERIDEAVVVVEAGDRVERADLLAPRAAPEVERRGVARVGVFPEALARAERVDDDLACARDPLEELEEAARDVREAEDVDRARQGRRCGLERGDRLVQRDEPRRARRPPLGEAALAEHRAATGGAATLRSRACALGRAPSPAACAHAGEPACRRASTCTPRRGGRCATRAARGAGPSGSARVARRRAGTRGRARARRARAPRRRAGARSAIASSAAASARRAPPTAPRRPRRRSP